MTQDKHTIHAYDCHEGDGFIFDGEKFLNIAPSMERYAVIRLFKQRDQLIEALEYARRFLKPEDVDMAYIDQALSNAKGGNDE